MYVLEFRYVKSSKKIKICHNPIWQKIKMAAIFCLNMTNCHKLHRFVDIKFIFVAICMFLRTTISNMTQLFIFHFPIWQKYKMAVIFKGTNLLLILQQFLTSVRRHVEYCRLHSQLPSCSLPPFFP